MSYKFEDHVNNIDDEKWFGLGENGRDSLLNHDFAMCPSYDEGHYYIIYKNLYRGEPLYQIGECEIRDFLYQVENSWFNRLIRQEYSLGDDEDAIEKFAYANPVQLVRYALVNFGLDNVENACVSGKV